MLFDSTACKDIRQTTAHIIPYLIIIESVGIPKRSFDDWFWEKAGSIPVRIDDKDVKAELLKDVSWAKNQKLD